MLGNFNYSNPTKLYFGEDAQKNRSGELKNYGTKVLLTYGGGFIKANGIYDEMAAAKRIADRRLVQGAIRQIKAEHTPSNTAAKER